MNIQPSVIIWTVICFLILTVILKNLLFTPVLNVLDSRKRKIEDAEQKKNQIEKTKLENEKIIAEQRIQAEAERKKQSKDFVQKIQSEGKEKIETAQRQCLENIKQYREDINGEYEEIVDSVAPEMETAAAIFARNIISHRK